MQLTAEFRPFEIITGFWQSSPGSDVEIQITLLQVTFVSCAQMFCLLVCWF